MKHPVWHQTGLSSRSYFLTSGQSDAQGWA